MNEHPLAAKWRKEAERDEQRGDPRAAAIGRIHADELDAYKQRRALEALPLQRAADESGYSADHLRRLIAQGKLDNAGEKHRPRIRRADLPKKPGNGRRPLPRTPSGDPDLAGGVLEDQGVTLDP